MHIYNCFIICSNRTMVCMKSLLNLFFWSFFSTCMWHTQSSLGNEGWQVHLQRCQRDHCRLRRLQGMCDGVMRMKSRYRSRILVSPLPPLWVFIHLPCHGWHAEACVSLPSLDFQSLVQGRVPLHTACCHVTHHKDRQPLEALPQPQPRFPGSSATTWLAIPAGPFSWVSSGWWFPQTWGLLHGLPPLPPLVTLLPVKSSAQHEPPLVSPLSCKQLSKQTVKEWRWSFFVGRCKRV